VGYILRTHTEDGRQMREQSVTAQLGVAPDAGAAAYISRYLRVTRRYRMAGCVAVVITHGAGAGRSHGFVVVLCGWLAGAILAELRLGWGAGEPRPARNAVPLWLLAVPAALGAAAFGAVFWLLSLARQPTQTFHWYAWEALAVCAAAAATSLYVLRRRSRSNIDDDTDLALRARSVAAMTAVAMVIVMLLPLTTAENAGAWSIRSIESLANGLGLMWALAAFALGLVITRSGRWWTPGGRPSLVLSAAATVLVLVTAGWLGVTAAKLHAPYTIAAVRPTATIRLTDEQHYQVDEAALGLDGVPPVLIDGRASRLFIGRVDLTRPKNAPRNARYGFVVIDKRTNTAVVIADQSGSSGWDTYLEEVDQRYPWLSALKPRKVGGDYELPGAAIDVSASDAGPVLFSGSIEDDATVTAQDLEVVMIFVGPDGQVYWAAPVPIRT
jgi:hypothetical protein